MGEGGGGQKKRYDALSEMRRGETAEGIEDEEVFGRGRLAPRQVQADRMARRARSPSHSRLASLITARRLRGCTECTVSGAPSVWLCHPKKLSLAIAKKGGR